MDKLPARRPAAPDSTPVSSNPVVRWLMLFMALLCLALGVIGVFVPGLPTTVFILAAAWFAARGSPRLLAWLEDHRLFGPILRDWRLYRSVSRRAKWSATIAMSGCAAVLWIAARNHWAASAGTLAMLVVAVWLWLRPEGPSETRPPGS